MKMPFSNQRFGALLSIALGCMLASACSSSQSDEEGLLPTEETTKESSDESAAAHTKDAETMAAKAAKMKKSESPRSQASKGGAIAGTTSNKADNSPAANGSAGGGGGPAGSAVAAAPTTVEPTRVVRYVKADSAALRSGPSDQAQALGQLVKGDRVLVVEENGWGRISDGLYIRLDDVSKKAVAAERQPAQWTAPAH